MALFCVMHKNFPLKSRDFFAFVIAYFIKTIDRKSRKCYNLFVPIK